MQENIYEVLLAREAYLSLGVQGFYGGQWKMDNMLPTLGQKRDGKWNSTGT